MKNILPTILIVIVLMALSLWFSYIIAASDLPEWFKWYLLK